MKMMERFAMMAERYGINPNNDDAVDGWFENDFLALTDNDKESIFKVLFNEASEIKFDGNNYGECEKFLEGNFDNTLKYPNVIIGNGGTIPVDVGDFIIKDNNCQFSVLKVKK